METSFPNSFAPTGGELRHGFRAAGLYLVPAERVLTEVVAQADVFPVPKSSATLAGLMNLRGTIVPIFDPQLAGQVVTNINPAKRHVLVFDRDEQMLGLLLEGNPELMSMVPAPGEHSRPVSVLSDFLVRPWIRQGQPSQVWWELDHRAAFEFLARAAPRVTSFAAPSAGSLVDRSEVVL